MPGRERWLHRAITCSDAPAAARRAAQLHLGKGSGQRHGAGRAARAGPDAGCGRRAARRDRPGGSTDDPRARRRRLRQPAPGAQGRAGGADPAAQRHARRLAGQITLTLQASLLARHAPAAVWDAFSRSRLGGDANGSGQLPARPGDRSAACRRRPRPRRHHRGGRQYCYQQVGSADADLAWAPHIRWGRPGTGRAPTSRCSLRGSRAGSAVPVRRRRHRDAARALTEVDGFVWHCYPARCRARPAVCLPRYRSL